MRLEGSFVCYGALKDAPEPTVPPCLKTGSVTFGSFNNPGKVSAAAQALRANEEAALAWHRGQGEQALALWQTQKDNVPVLFNRGMASLFLGRPPEAQTALRAAVAQLPDTSAWHHLGHLYLALATARG